MADPTWKEFLSSQSAHWDSVGVHHFGESKFPITTRDLVSLIDLSHWGSLLVAGKDAKKFLQGQLTCDLNAVSQEKIQRGARCNAKGRAEFSFYIVEIPLNSKLAQGIEIENSDNINCYLLIMPKSVLDLAYTSLNKFIVFSKAKIFLSEHIQLFGLIESVNSSSETILDTGQATSKNSQFDFKIDPLRQIVATHITDAKEFWLDAAKNYQPCGYPQWTLAGIEMGMADIENEISEECIPQHLNFHLTYGISFKKGCYIGQEVIARLEYKGTLKKHMRRARIESDTLPILGAEVFSSKTQQNVGLIVSAIQIDSDSIEVLTVINDSAFDDNDAFFDSQKNYKLHFLPLPYAITK